MQHIKFHCGHLITKDKAIIKPKQKWIHKDNNWIVEIKCCNKNNPNHIDIDAILPDSVEFYFNTETKNSKKMERNYVEFIQNYDLILFENFLDNFNSSEILDLLYGKILDCYTGWYEFLDRLSANISPFDLGYIFDKLKENDKPTHHSMLGKLITEIKSDGYIIIEPRNLSEEIELETLLENYDRI